MSKIPFKRLSSRSTFRNFANSRNTFFVLIFCGVIVYVIWTSSGNSTILENSQQQQQQQQQQPETLLLVVPTTTTKTTKITTTFNSNLLIKSNNNNNHAKALLNIPPPPPAPPQSPPKHIHSDPDPKEHNFPLRTSHSIKSDTHSVVVAAQSVAVLDNIKKLSKITKSIGHNNNKSIGAIIGAAKTNNNKNKRPLTKSTSEALSINDSMVVCNENSEDIREYVQNRPRNEYNDLPIIYFVTPTYPRREQIPELTRLGQTLMHVPRIHWIVADDVDSCNGFLDFLLTKFGIPYTHISSPMPDTYRSKSPSPRGVANRRAALTWLRNNNKKSGVLYFGDDDNTFDLKLFSEIRDTKKVSMFPVGLIGLYAVSTPVIKEGKVIGFFDSWPAKRKWPVDMAGFAVSLQYFSQHPNATMPYKAGYEEDAFLRSISLKIDDIEPKASNCTEVLVWHTQTQKTKAPTVRIESQYLDSDKSSLGPLFRELESMAMSHSSDSTGIKAQISKDGKSKSISFFFR